jgi:hypothetical protein
MEQLISRALLIPAGVLVALLLAACDTVVEIEVANATARPLVVVIFEPTATYLNLYAISRIDPDRMGKTAWAGTPGSERSGYIAAYDDSQDSTWLTTFHTSLSSPHALRDYIRDRPQLFCRRASLRDVRESPLRITIQSGVNECPPDLILTALATTSPKPR